jgi:gluconolactonase
MKKLTIQIGSILKSKTLLFTFLLLGFCINGMQAQDTLTNIIPEGSTLIKLSSNQYTFTEGPVWFNDSLLLFTDDGITSQHNILQYNPVGNHFSMWPNNSAHCLGLTCDKAGNLLGCSDDIVMMNKAGEVIKTVAATYNGNSFNSPNDVIADDIGGVYFSDPNYFGAPSQDKEAVYYVDSIGIVTRIIDDLAKPNGIVLSPDGSKLYVGDANTNYVYSWNVTDGGSVSGKSIFAELETTGGPLAGSDGMAVDINGNIYIATEKGIQIFSSQGEAIIIIEASEETSNCDFGGTDFKTLFITARKNLYSIDLNYPGYAVSRIGFPGGINSVSNNPLVEIYPNPASDILYVQQNSGKVNSLDILDMDGSKEFISLKKEEDTGIEINIQNLKPGMYLLRIVYNERIITRKFVKE